MVTVVRYVLRACRPIGWEYRSQALDGRWGDDRREALNSTSSTVEETIRRTMTAHMTTKAPLISIGAAMSV